MRVKAVVLGAVITPSFSPPFLSLTPSRFEASADNRAWVWVWVVLGVEVSGVRFTRHVFAKTLSILWEWLLAEATFTGVVEAPSESFAP